MLVILCHYFPLPMNKDRVGVIWGPLSWWLLLIITVVVVTVMILGERAKRRLEAFAEGQYIHCKQPLASLCRPWSALYSQDPTCSPDGPQGFMQGTIGKVTLMPRCKLKGLSKG